MTAQPQRTVIELIRRSVARGAAAAAEERSHLLPEDLLDDPIEWSLAEYTSQVMERTVPGNKVFSLH